MALGIPLPGDMAETLRRGVDTGSSMYSRIMQPILERERQKQAEKNFMRSQNQANEHFMQQMALRKAGLAQSGANSDLQRRILEENLLGLQHRNDPMYEFNQFKALQDMITGGGMGGGRSPAEPQQPAPAQEMGEGMGMFSPQGMQEAQKAPSVTASAAGDTADAVGGVSLDALRQNPLLRGFFKHKFGYDPIAMPQTPEDKRAASLDLFQQKENIKKQNKGGDIPTNTVLTQNQQAIQGIKTVIPMLDELIKNPKSVYGPTDFSPSKKAAYNAKTSGMIDTLVAAQSLPKVQASIDLVEQQIRRATNESVDSYIKRLKDLRKDLVNRQGRAKSVLENRKVDTGARDDFSNMSDEELRQIAGGG